MRMTRNEAINLFKGIYNLPKKEYNRFFLYAVEKTKGELKELVSEVSNKEMALVYDEKIREFETARIEILKEYANKDESGTAIIIDGRYDIPEETMSTVQSKLAEISGKYNDDFVRVDGLRAEFEAFIKEEIDVNIVKTSFKTLPDTLDQETFLILMKLVKESDEEIQALVG